VYVLILSYVNVCAHTHTHIKCVCVMDVVVVGGGDEGGSEESQSPRALMSSISHNKFCLFLVPHHACLCLGVGAGMSLVLAVVCW
jgi:hypothetical protein